ncbi:arginyl-tRNA synthetase [Spiroplasma sp. TIUS-1]|uniref:arginine--tRNA ligase n=1 Tax=Spiroplasma sp. TIUS-1 TaxID=216963 RepID=UPI0013975040|nr:arginine--tRNA ligase [Spiroplasma sp. TIUS-1]QHX35880.1 arginyl-tRNA synthetase [Spiroplasma sp. TIUS-1]
MSVYIEKIEIALMKIMKNNKLNGSIIIEKTRDSSNGDFSTNFAMVNSKINNSNPRMLATLIVDELKKEKIFSKVEIAGPGFINMFLNSSLNEEIISEVYSMGNKYGSFKKRNFKYNLELVSANPTGYLHVGHARNGAIGDSVARILKFAGYDVETEYYTNDAGNQINISACTLFFHYKQLLKSPVNKPEEMYGGDMYIEVAQSLVEKFGDKYIKFNIGTDNKINDEKIHELFKTESITLFMAAIKQQLINFGVGIDLYTSEADMYKNNEIEKTLDIYKKKGKTFEQDGALWLKTTEFGDDKDRVLKKSNGDYTYITPDLACHNVRFKRSKSDKYVNYWGGDHHGYILRIRSGLALLGHDFNALDIDMIQMVRLMKNGEEFKMSKRKGTAIWLIDLIEMVGKDSVRYMLLSKTPSSHMDFDLDIAVQKNSTNPVYYAQYATARSYKILEKAKEEGWKFNPSSAELLIEQKEKELLILIDSFQKEVAYAADSRLPNVICEYIQTLSRKFHSYYTETKIFDIEDKELMNQRLNLVSTIYQVLSNSFNLIGISVINNM